MGKNRINTDKLKEIINLVKIGFSHRDAAEHVGLSLDTFQRVLRMPLQYKKVIEDVEELVAELKRVKQWAKIYHIKNIHKKAEEHPNLSTWWLERCFPDEFGKRDRQVISTEDDKPFVLKVVLDKNSEDEG